MPGPDAHVPQSIVVREIAADEQEYWDEQIQTFSHAHPLNAYDWGRVRQVDGWRPIHLVAERDGRFCGALLLLTRRLPLLPYSIFYGPHGPVCQPHDRAVLEALHGKVAALAKRHHAIVLRIDPNIRESDAGEFTRLLKELGYHHLEQRWTFWTAPRDEYRIDLTERASVDELHNALDRDTRRCIRKSAKEGLRIEPGSSEQDLQAFYAIFSDFSVTKGFMARGYEYQKHLWHCYVARGRGRLFLAKLGDEVIGGLLCIRFGGKCVAMHMGTPYKYQKLQPSYAYVWESIAWAKDSGCEWYSFRGVGTTPTQEAFKRKFNPKVVALAGYFDYPFKPLLYALYAWGEFSLLPAAWPFLVRARRFVRNLRTGALARFARA